MGRKKTRDYNEWSTAAVKRETKEQIEKFGTAGDTFDEALRKILRLVK